MQFVKSAIKVRIYGESSSPLYIQEIQNIISQFQLQEVVVFSPHWLAEEEKVSVLADSLAVAYLPFDEDSYGYPCLEAFHSSKPVLTLSDSGGVLELVQEGICGRIIEPTPHAIAAALDELYFDQIKTRSMGLAAKQRVAELRISWDHVIVSLLQ
jgi:glycosyltransferase involved in cell wall biosynthesis